MDYISLRFVTTVPDNSSSVYMSHSCIKPLNLWPQIVLPPLIQMGFRGWGRRGYSPGSAGRVWYDILLLKLAVEVQGAGDGCLWGGYRPNIRSEVCVKGQTQQQRSLCWICIGCCEFSFGKSFFHFVFCNLTQRLASDMSLWLDFIGLYGKLTVQEIVYDTFLFLLYQIRLSNSPFTSLSDTF